MTLNSSNITYDGLEDGYTLTFVTDKSSVIVSGTQSDIDTLSGTTLKGKIDVTGLGTGTHTVTVKPNLDETKYTWGEIKVQIVIGREGDGGGTTGTDGAGTASGSTTGGTTSGGTGVRHRAAHRQETPEITALTVHHIDRYIPKRGNKSGSTKNNNQKSYRITFTSGRQSLQRGNEI